MVVNINSVLPTNCLSVSGHVVGLAFKGLEAKLTANSELTIVPSFFLSGL